nr:tyrosine-type recombinase/integrase [Gilliamella apicola]
MFFNRLSHLVRSLIEQANIGKSGSCHLFQHTMATLMLENGADLRWIQAMLGHASPETTQIYTQVSIRALKDIHTATYPAASLSRKRKTAKTTPKASQKAESKRTKATTSSDH